ncbi:MAG: hypothetical protein NTY09_03155 [bacterium]|nr:hypothetical protein [bacterium]
MASDDPKDTEATPGEIRWRVLPLAENAWRSLLLVVIIIAACYGVWSWTELGGFVLLAFILLVVSIAPFIFPTRYHMNSEGLEIIFLGIRNFRGWEEYRNFYPHDVGVHLSPFKELTRLDPFRGNFIRFSPGNRGEVIGFLDRHIKRAGKADGERGDKAKQGESEERK